MLVAFDCSPNTISFPSASKLKLENYGTILQTTWIQSIEDPYLGFAKGVYRWNTGQRDQAVRAWKLNFEKHGWNAASSLAALIHTH